MDWELFSKTAAKRVLSKAETKETTLRKIKAGTQAPLRSFEVEEARAGVLEVLYLCASFYMGVKPPESKEDKEKIMLYQKAASVIVENFSWISALEIDEAFSLAASGKIKADLRAFYGTFNINAIGQLLKAYKEHRNKVLAAVQEEINKKKREEEEKVKKEMLNEEARAAFCSEVLKWVQMSQEGFPPFEDWREIPSIKAEAAFKSGAIIFEGDESKIKAEIWRRAGALTVEEMQRETRQEIEEGRKGAASIKALLKTIKEGQKPKGYEGKRQKIYSQLLLWEFIKPKY